MHKKIGFFLLVFFNYYSNVYCQNADSLIQIIIDQTNLDSLTSNVEILSGEKNWIINDTSFTIISRHANHLGNEIAADFIKYKLESLELDTYVQSYSSSGRNIYAIQMGYLYPEKYYLICAHYDDMPDGPIAPGADDNASGVASVLEAARILSKFNPAYSIIYALWDEEEVAHNGSLYFAEQASLNGLDIQAVINTDMIGWDSDNDNEFEIHIDSSGNSSQIAETIVGVNTIYNINLFPFIYSPGTFGSDHASFWLYGYKALLIIERFWGNDLNWYLHTLNDKIEHFNFPYFHKLSKLSIGALACLAFNVEISGIDSNIEAIEYALKQNFPNPFNPSTTIYYSIPEFSFVTLILYDVLGNEIATLVNEEKVIGSYEVEFDATTLPSGIYFYKLQAGSFIETKKMVLIR
jgi:hypothetical protein